ncbi:MAG: ACT domain protein [Methanomassiliicoccaceae archaeon]|jgi:predicted amino acid-binding ACT domain protein|nr:ACT domain protein [Methanomassiliicoccaceae archaeon]
MKVWEFVKVAGPNVRIDRGLSESIGLVDGGYVYSTLFEYRGDGAKEYELILSAFPQENYRTLTNVTAYMRDIPGATAQAAKFLGSRSVNILNSVSLNAISDTVIIWKMLVDLSFAGEADILSETFKTLKASNDPSVSKLDHIEFSPADIGRVFRTKSAGSNKAELRRGAPVTMTDSTFDTSVEYSDLLKNTDGSTAMIIVDPSSWMLSITFFKKDTKLVRMTFSIPDCPGSIQQVVDHLANENANLISVFSKVKICYQTMTLDITADLGACRHSIDGMMKELPKALSKMNGIFELTEYKKLN